jgi:urea carboxylase
VCILTESLGKEGLVLHTGLPRYSFAGDEYLFVQVGHDMELGIIFQVQAICNAIMDEGIPGVIEAYPANTSYLVHYNPDEIAPDTLLEKIKKIGVLAADYVPFDSRLIEIPILYNDPWSVECTKAFAANHQDPSVTNLEYVARTNRMSVPEFIRVQTSLQYFMTMFRFLPGTQCFFPMVERSKALACPTYVVPRQWTPDRVLNMGGVFVGLTAHDRQPGGYQLLGRSPAPVYDAERRLVDLKESILLNPGDRIKVRSIGMGEYKTLRASVEAGEYRYKIVKQTFEPLRYFEDPENYLRLLEGGLRDV